MVQSISTVDFDSSVSLINGTRKMDNSEIKAAFEAALSQSSGADSADSSKKTDDSDSIMDEFKKLSQGMTVCGKCGTIYRGTAVVRCSKCGNDMKEDSENSSKMQGVSKYSGVSNSIQSANVAGAQLL